MTFRKATEKDLPKLYAAFNLIADNLNGRGIHIWDEVYPNCAFPEDVQQGRLYILENDGDIISAFALMDEDGDRDSVRWEDQNASACYLYRMGMIPSYYGKGIGAYMLKEAARLTKEKGREYLRLFVADINPPAIRFYEKNGYTPAEGILDRFELNFLLYGYEKRV